MYKVSIIVPVYNAGFSLDVCVRNILNQTYNNIELILINDGSTDNSLDICTKYQEKDKRVRVLNQVNMGVSSARNNGIRNATGEYIQFVDSDDFIDINMTEILVESIEKNDASMVICGYKSFDFPKGVNTKISCPPFIGFYTYNEFLTIFYNLYLNLFINPVWNKIYRTRFINDNCICFPEKDDLGEDLMFNIEIIKHCVNVQIITDCLYNYIKYENQRSLTAKLRKNIYLIQRMLYKNVISIYRNNGLYDKQIEEINIFYTKIIMDAIIHLADCYSLQESDSFCKAVEEIQTDQVFIKMRDVVKFDTIKHKILKLTIKRKMIKTAFLCLKAFRFI